MRRLPAEVHVDVADGRVVLQVRGNTVRLSADDTRVVIAHLTDAVQEIEPVQVRAMQTEPGAP
jgi:hypothetical protein